MSTGSETGGTVDHPRCGGAYRRLTSDVTMVIADEARDDVVHVVFGESCHVVAWSSHESSCSFDEVDMVCRFVW